MKPGLMNLLPTHVRETTMRWAESWRLKVRLPACNRADCSRSRRAWNRISSGGASLRLNGLRYCFPGCFEQALARRLEEAQRIGDWNPRPPHRMPLGLLMLSRGDFGPEQLRAALDAQRANGGGLIGEWIEKLGYAREHQVTSALAKQWACPVLRHLPARAADCGVPYQLLQRFHMVPVYFSRAGRILHIAFSGGIEYSVLLAIEQMLECKTAPCLATFAAIAEMLNRMDEEQPKPEKVFDGMRSPEDMARITASYAARLGGRNVRTAVCGEYLWIRIEGEAGPANLLFVSSQPRVTFGRIFPSRPPVAVIRAPQPMPPASASSPSVETSLPALPAVYPAEPARRSP